jgi:hypothetical protein
MASDQDEADVTALLERDVASTLGDGHRELITISAKHARQFHAGRADYFCKVVEDVQQYFHDCRIDITWPACPNHPNHPMWFENGMWCADGRPVAELGQLGNWLRRART